MKKEALLEKIQRDITLSVYLLHSLKLVHRDIKPHNILYSQRLGKYIFCDFGLTHSVKENYD